MPTWVLIGTGSVAIVLMAAGLFMVLRPASVAKGAIDTCAS